MSRRRGLAFVIFAVSMTGLGVLVPTGINARAGKQPSWVAGAVEEPRGTWVVQRKGPRTWVAQRPLGGRAEDFVADAHLAGY